MHCVSYQKLKSSRVKFYNKTKQGASQQEVQVNKVSKLLLQCLCDSKHLIEKKKNIVE